MTTHGGRRRNLNIDTPEGRMTPLRYEIVQMILLIPDGWQMPLGWNQVVAQAQEAIGGKP